MTESSQDADKPTPPRKAMDIKQIRQLVKLMVDNDLTELNIKDGPSKVHLRRGPDEVQVVPAPAAMTPAAMTPAAPAPPPAAGGEGEAGPGGETKTKSAENLIEVKSPMVGTFYSSASPDTDPYVSQGDRVADDTVVCIVEAMKVMNEIKAECTGTIAEVCVQNAQPVEFGQVLYRVRP